jgi:hypothetical protein
VLILVEMFGGVLVLRRVAASDLAARKAHAQVNPLVTRFNAFLTYVFGGLFDLDLVEMGAFSRHRFLQRVGTVDFRDLSHVTKGHNHITQRPLSLTMMLGGHFSRASS